MDAEAAGEEPVGVGHVDDVVGAGAGCPQGTGHDPGPHVEVVLGVAHHRLLAGGAAGSVDAGDVPHGHGEEAEGIVVPQVLLDREREPGEVGKAFQVFRPDPVGVELVPVMGHVIVGVPEGPSQPLQLQRCDLVPAGAFDRLNAAGHCHPPVMLLSKGRHPKGLPAGGS